MLKSFVNKVVGGNNYKVNQLRTVFDIPNDIYAGLLNGDYIRRGGVIQKSNKYGPKAGEVVMWLREGSISPVSPESLVGGGNDNSGIANALNLFGSVASVINLGATIYFGTKAIDKLNNINGKIDDLQSNVDIGFLSVLNTLSELKEYHEINLISDIKNAASLAWGAQTETDDSKRAMRLIGALEIASSVSEKLISHVSNDVKNAIEYLNTFKYGYDIVNELDDIVLSALKRFRQTCIAVYLRSSIDIDNGNIKAAIGNLEKDINVLSYLLKEIGQSFLRGKGDVITYDELFNKQWINIISPKRVVIWGKRFDDNVESFEDIIDQLGRITEGKKMTRFDETCEWSDKTIKNLPIFADLLDGAYEDLDRLKGYLSEYKTMDNMGLSIREYKDMLKIEDIKDGQKLLYITSY